MANSWMKSPNPFKNKTMKDICCHELGQTRSALPIKALHPFLLSTNSDLPEHNAWWSTDLRSHLAEIFCKWEAQLPWLRKIYVGTGSLFTWFVWVKILTWFQLIHRLHGYYSHGGHRWDYKTDMASSKVYQQFHLQAVVCWSLLPHLTQNERNWLSSDRVARTQENLLIAYVFNYLYDIL